MSVSRVLRAAVWAALALLLGGALFVSVGRAAAALDEAEASAQTQAEDYANTVLYRALPPATLDAPIEAREYGEILVDVQAGILSDDDVVRVRVWSDAGRLVFSSDQRDRLGQGIASAKVLAEVLRGSTVSEDTGGRVPQLPGLAGSNERLLRTYAPLRLGDEPSPSGVAEIEQRYSAIRAVANRTWRPIQAGITVALVAALVMLVLSVRRAVTARTSLGDPRAAERVRSLERRLRDAEKRVRESGERFGELSTAKSALEEQLATSERNLRDTLTARRVNEEEAAVLIERVPELERQLAEARARATAAEAAASGVSQEELAAVQTRAAQVEAERDGLTARVEELKTAASEGAAAQTRVAELEGRLAELEQRLTQSLKQAQSDLDRTSVRLSETQALLAESTDELTRLHGELDAAQRDKADAIAAARRAGEATGERDHEAEHLHTILVAKDAELQQLRAEAVAKNAELERMGAEVQQAHEQLANAQLEMSQARGRIEELMGLAARAGPTTGSPTSAAPTPPVPAEPTSDGARTRERAAESTEALSIRERLSRAAAARNRPSGPSEES
jgi:predicted  nucleic acid-binding Zn-ribbon protein